MFDKILSNLMPVTVAERLMLLLVLLAAFKVMTSVLAEAFFAIVVK